MKTKYYLVTLVLMLAGCASLVDPVTYVQPQAGPRARIRLVADNSSPTRVSTFRTPDCKSSTQKIASLGQHLIPDLGYGRRVDIPLGEGYSPKVMTEVYIPANRSFPLMFYWFSGGSVSESCTNQIVFDPVENGMYEAVFTIDSRTCSTKVYKIVPGPGAAATRTPESSVRRLDGCTYRD